MTEEQRKSIEALRTAGYAVTIFTPEELRDADPESVQDRLVELGWDVIDCLSTEPAHGEKNA